MVNRLLDLRRNSIVTVFLTNYIVVLIVPLVLMSVIYYNCLQTMEKNTIKSNISFLEKSKDMLEGRFQEIDNIIGRISLNTKVKSYNNVAAPLEGKNIYKTIETSKSIFDYSLTNSLIKDFFIIYPESGILIGPQLIFKIEDFYSKYFYFDNMNFEKWKVEIFNEANNKFLLPERNATYDKKRYSFITYIDTYDKKHNCKIMFFLYSNEIKKYIEGFDISDGGYAYIADENNNIICSTSLGDKDFSPTSFNLNQYTGYIINKVNGNKMLVSYVVSKINGWKYVVVQPYRTVMKKVYSIKGISYITIISALLLGIIIAFLLSYRNSKNIKGIFNLFESRFSKNSGKIKDPFKYIQDSVNQIVRNNDMLNDTLHEQVLFLKNTFFQQLINGKFLTEKELLIYSQYTGVDFKSDGYGAVIVRILGYGEDKDNISDEILKDMDIRRMKLKSVLQKHCFSKAYFYEIDNNQILIVFNLNKEELNKYEDCIIGYFNRVKHILTEAFGIDICFVAGKTCSKPLSITGSIQQIFHMIDYIKNNLNFCSTIFWCNKDFSKGNEYYYPKEIENKLINIMKDGDMEKAECVLSKLYSENYVKRKLLPNALKIFLYQLYGTIIRVEQELSMETKTTYSDIDQLDKKIFSFDEHDEAFNYIKSILLSVCLTVNEKKKRKDQELFSKIKKYIEDNYCDQNLSLSQLSNEFYYSAAYLSVFFKNNMGCTLSSYLEKLRMQKAQHLLVDTHLSIKDIYGKVGYNSENSFCRAFKRFCEVSPSKYRENSLNNKEF